MERIERINETIRNLEARYAAETNHETKECIGAALDAWYNEAKWAKVDAGIVAE